MAVAGSAELDPGKRADGRGAGVTSALNETRRDLSSAF